MRELIRRLYFAIRPSDRMVIMDYAIDPKPVYTENNPHKRLFEIIAGNNSGYEELLRYALGLKQGYITIKEMVKEKDLLQPTWNNNYVPGLDIIILYTLLTYLKPKRYIEIGSGTTTKTAFKARQDHNLSFSITCIDPNPRQEIRPIADEWHSSMIQDIPLDLFKKLSENDIVFFDGTHMLYPNSDVMWFFLEVLPILPRGVIVEVHDIYIPYDYPRFMCDKYYSENYLLGALFLNNPDKYEIIAPTFYMSVQNDLANILKEIWDYPNLKNVERHGGSFWFKIK